MGDSEERKYEWWLSEVRGVGAGKKKILWEMYGNGKEIYQSLYNIEEKQFGKWKGLSDQEIIRLRSAARSVDLEREYQKFIKLEIGLVCFYDRQYPERLRKLPGMPYALYVKGELPRDDIPSIGIVGARRCTPYGEAMAIRFSEKLAEAGVQIISGMAKGIDGASQRAAIRAGGKSFAVLGCGTDICYPREHQGLYRDLQAHGGILSEQIPGSPPLREYFPARNRMISGLSDVVLVMEARSRSGSLITADFALEQGKDVYALPGPADSDLSRGCHELIRQGAGILISPSVLLEELKISYPEKKGMDMQKDRKNEKMLERDEKLLYASIGLFPKNLDTLIRESDMKTIEIMRILTSLELKGYIRELSKNYFVRT